MPSPDTGRWNRTSRALAAAALLFFGWPVQAQKPPDARLTLCMACHGPQGNSQIASTPSLAGQPKLFLENQLVLIREGLRDIPSMKGQLDGLKDTELTALAAYFSVQAPVRTPSAVDPVIYQRGQQISRQMLCGTCHLPDYTGREQIPRLAGQQEEFLLYSMKQLPSTSAGPATPQQLRSAVTSPERLQE